MSEQAGRLLPAWVNEQMAEQAERHARSIRRWAGDCTSADDLEELAAELREGPADA